MLESMLFVYTFKSYSLNISKNQEFLYTNEKYKHKSWPLNPEYNQKQDVLSRRKCIVWISVKKEVKYYMEI